MNRPIAPIGDNSPPPEQSFDLADELAERHTEKLERFAELTVAFAKVPAVIADDDACGDAQDLFKQMREARADAETARKAEQRPYKAALDQVAAFFEKPGDIVARLQAEVKFRIEKYMAEKKAKELRDKAAKAEAERAERDRRLQEAAEAEARAAKAEAERLAAEWAERAARERREREQRLAAEARELAKELIDRMARSAAEAEAAAATARAEAARKEQVKFRIEKNKAETKAAHAERDADLAQQGADRADARAGRLERQTALAGADLSRTRGDLGTVGSLAKTWRFDVVDREAIPLDALRGYLNPAAVDAALQKFMMDHRLDPGGPQLAGVVFEQVEGVRIK